MLLVGRKEAEPALNPSTPADPPSPNASELECLIRISPEEMQPRGKKEQLFNKGRKKGLFGVKQMILYRRAARGQGANGELLMPRSCTEINSELSFYPNYKSPSASKEIEFILL